LAKRKFKQSLQILFRKIETLRGAQNWRYLAINSIIEKFLFAGILGGLVEL